MAKKLGTAKKKILNLSGEGEYMFRESIPTPYGDFWLSAPSTLDEISDLIEKYSNMLMYARKIPRSDEKLNPRDVRMHLLKDNPLYNTDFEKRRYLEHYYSVERDRVSKEVGTLILFLDEANNFDAFEPAPYEKKKVMRGAEYDLPEIMPNLVFPIEKLLKQTRDLLNIKEVGLKVAELLARLTNETDEIQAQQQGGQSEETDELGFHARSTD